MWKFLIAVPLALATDPTPKTTVDLKAIGCTATRICYSVHTDGVNADGTPVVIDYISASASYGRVTLSLNGVLWDTGLYGVYPMPEDLTNVHLTDPAGRTMVLSIDYTHWVTLNHSGHNYYVQHWRLDSGSFVIE
jgi:hypothetical protein